METMLRLCTKKNRNIGCNPNNNENNGLSAEKTYLVWGSFHSRRLKQSRADQKSSKIHQRRTTIIQ
jgi:hypothetical protein